MVSPAKNLPSLEKINLDDCSKLKNVLIQSDSLEDISFQRCAELEKIVLQCPRLKNISLGECSNLEVRGRGGKGEKQGKKHVYLQSVPC